MTALLAFIAVVSAAILAYILAGEFTAALQAVARWLNRED